MEPTLVAALTAKQFLDLLPLETGLAQGCLVPDRSELADLLLAWIARQPHRYEDLPGLLAELWRPGALQLLTGDSLQQPRNLDPGWLWLPSTPLSNPAPEGTPLDRWTPSNAVADLPLGARLLGIKRAVLEEALAVRRSQPRNQAGNGYRAPAPLWEQARDAEELPDPIDPSELGLSSGSLQPPPCANRQHLDSALICSSAWPTATTSARLIEQVLLDCDSRLGGISLLHLGQILESLGLDVRPLPPRPASCIVCSHRP